MPFSVMSWLQSCGYQMHIAKWLNSMFPFLTLIPCMELCASINSILNHYPFSKIIDVTIYNSEHNKTCHTRHETQRFFSWDNTRMNKLRNNIVGLHILVKKRCVINNVLMFRWSCNLLDVMVLLPTYSVMCITLLNWRKPTISCQNRLCI